MGKKAPLRRAAPHAHLLVSRQILGASSDKPRVSRLVCSQLSTSCSVLLPRDCKKQIVSATAGLVLLVLLAVLLAVSVTVTLVPLVPLVALVLLVLPLVLLVVPLAAFREELS